MWVKDRAACRSPRPSATRWWRLLFVVGAGQAVEDGVLPLAHLGLQLGGDVGLLIEEVGLLGGIGLEVEEFLLANNGSPRALPLPFRLLVFLVNDELVVSL